MISTERRKTRQNHVYIHTYLYILYYILYISLHQIYPYDVTRLTLIVFIPVEQIVEFSVCTFASELTRGVYDSVCTSGDSVVRLAFVPMLLNWVISIGIAWTFCQIRKIMGCTCARNAGNVFPTTNFKPLISNPDMHYGTCVALVPWCMSGSLTRSGGENFPAFLA